jgi:outer membrane protein OmpA-like peptidoglycan-associated protein
MTRIYLIPVLGFATLLAACSSTPEQIPELDNARTLVAGVEASPRAGAAAAQISEARKALDRANDLAQKGEDLDEIKYQAQVASLNAQIANEAILTAQAKDDIEKGNAERQQVLLEARERESQRLQEQMRELQAQQTERGMVLTLGDVLFDTGKSTLKAGAYSTIDRLAQVLKESPNRKVMIEGHTDSTGSEETNQLLSQQRALAVQSALLERGVPAAQVAAVGKGESSPVASNDDAAGRQRNRRVDLIVSQDTSRVASE